MLVLPFGFLAAPAGGLPDIVTTGLTQWLAPEIATSTSEFVIDQSGNSNDASISGANWTWNGNNYLEITTASDNSNYISAIYKPDFSSAFSLQIWAYMVSTNGSNQAPLLHNRPTGNGAGVTAMFGSGGTTFGSYMFNNNPGGVVLNNSTAGYFNNWFMFTVTYDGINNAKAYASETLLESRSAYAMSSGQQTELNLGNVYDGNSNLYWTNLRVGSIKVYETELSSTDISTNFNAERTHYGV